MTTRPLKPAPTLPSGSTINVGWDPTLATFYIEAFNAHKDTTPTRTAGTTPYEIVDTDTLDVNVGRLAYLPTSIKQKLADDQLKNPSTFHHNESAQMLADFAEMTVTDPEQLARIAAARPLFT